MDYGALIGPALGAGGALISGLMGQSAGKKALKYQKYVDTHRLQMLVQDANAAGIHPLAALGATWSPSGITPQNYMGDAIGDAMAGFGRGVSDLYSQDADVTQRNKDRALQERLASADRSARATENAQANAAARAQALRQARFDDAQIRLMDAQSRSYLADARAKAIGGAGRSLSMPREVEAIAGPWKVGHGSQEQDWENEYGDIVGNIYGMVHAGSDLFDNYMPRLNFGFGGSGRGSRSGEAPLPALGN